MKQLTLELTITVSDNLNDLSEIERHLIHRATTACHSAYARYSHFHVGSAVLLANGEIITGSNQENAVYPLGMCAERVALFTAGNLYPTVPVIALALTTQKQLTDEEFPVFPCGSCRQVISEFEERFNQQIKLLIAGSNGKTIVVDQIRDILPFPFVAGSLADSP